MKQAWASLTVAAHYFGIAASSLNEGIKSGYLIQGVHYGVFPFLKGKRFNIHAIEKILVSKDEENEKIDDLAHKLLS